MSYLPIPPQAWSRVEDPCIFTVPGSTYQSAYIPLTGQTVSQAQANYEDLLLYKGNILQYKGNSARLTKSQRYSQLARGTGPNRTKVFATQTQTYSNPNTTQMQRVNYETFPFPNQLVGKPNNISGPFQYNVPSPFDCSGNAVQDGGVLVCGTTANQCTGQLIKANHGSASVCAPSYCSNVPAQEGRFIALCWNNKVQTWFPKYRTIMNNSGTKWPQNYKGFVSAVKPPPPILTLVTPPNVLAWTMSSTLSQNCLPISGYTIYVDGILYAKVPFTVTSFVLNEATPGTYNVYVTASSQSIESVPSNSVVVVV